MSWREEERLEAEERRRAKDILASRAACQYLVMAAQQVQQITLDEQSVEMHNQLASIQQALLERIKDLQRKPKRQRREPGQVIDTEFLPETMIPPLLPIPAMMGANF